MARVIAKYKPAKIIPQFVPYIHVTTGEICRSDEILEAPQNGNVIAENRCPGEEGVASRSLLSSPPRPLSPSLFPLSSDVYRVKLPPRYSSNFRSDEAARNCNDVFGRLTYRLGNLFIRIARRAPSEMYGIVGNLQTPPTRNENFRRLRPARR